MKLLSSILTAAALTLAAVPASATPTAGDTLQAEILGGLCAQGAPNACEHLVAITGGNCAAPAGSGCRYDAELRFAVVAPLEEMVLVPGLEWLGHSRISTAEHCAEIAGLTDWRAAITDSEYLSLEACLIEHT